MTLHEFLPLLENVHGGGGQYSAKCPAHQDHQPSLSISTGESGQILLNCHAGCRPQDITTALGLTMSDLYPQPAASTPKDKPQLVATYQYISPEGIRYEKLRFSDKSFRWRQPDGKGGWRYDRRGITPTLYGAGETPLPGFVYLVEGEKDVDSLKDRSAAAVSPPDGAKSKWLPQYTQALRGRRVVILPDNDAPGLAMAQTAAKALQGEAASIKILHLSKKWPSLPEKGDISDVLAMEPTEDVFMKLEELESETPEWEDIQVEDDLFFSCFKTLDAFEEQEATWLVPGWIPEGQITLLAADGGVGKTTLWCNILAATSSGRRCVLDPPDYTRTAQKVAFLTTEDSVRKKLKKKLRLAGANMENIITPDFIADKEGALRGLKFGSREMERFIKHFKPALCVFDPVQGFVPPDINMGSRNAMRDCMAPLISLGEEYGTTFIVVCHTNKRKGAWGRDRIADSADLWDVARSVMMSGFTEEREVRYISNEKNNYAQPQETILFSVNDDGQIQQEGTSWKRDKEYMADFATAISAPKREDCKEYILSALEETGGKISVKELEARAKNAGYRNITIRRAKDELKQRGEVRYFTTGFGKEKTWYIEKNSSIFTFPRQEDKNDQVRL